MRFDGPDFTAPCPFCERGFKEMLDGLWFHLTPICHAWPAILRVYRRREWRYEQRRKKQLTYPHAAQINIINAKPTTTPWETLGPAVPRCLKCRQELILRPAAPIHNGPHYTIEHTAPVCWHWENEFTRHYCVPSREDRKVKVL